MAAAAAVGQVITFMDADDLMHPDRTKALLNLLSRSAGFVCVLCAFCV